MRMTERQINVLTGAALLALLPLAWLQYGWISEVSEADQQRRRGEIRAALERIAQDAERAAGEFHATLIGPMNGGEVSLSRRMRDLAERDGMPPVKRVLVVHQHDDGTWQAERWDAASDKPVPDEVPDWWVRRGFRAGPIQADPPALLGPAFDRRSEEPAWILAELDPEAIAKEYLPRLLQRHLSEELFTEFAFRIATRRANQTIYTSSAETPSGPPDAAVGVIRQIRRNGGEPGPRPGMRGPRFKGPPPGAGSFVGDGIWQLEARHREGTLDEVVTRTRRRNLAVSAVTLLALGFALGALRIAVRRAQRLARLQLEFTAGVSHELRTPLAVIVSAGDNLAGGYIKDPQKIREYGALVRDEGTRLTGMVDEVLRFSALDAEQTPMEKRAMLLSDLMAGVEREMRPLAERQGGEWDAQCENASMQGDAAALHVAVRNLTENAIRHGGGKWVGIRAAKAGDSIVISVEDRGPGISPADMPHIFDAFYRGVESRAQQRKGSGLGLALVQRIARAHGGNVTATNRAEGGAQFTLTIPCG